MSRWIGPAVLLVLVVAGVWMYWGRVEQYDGQLTHRAGRVAFVFREATILFDGLPSTDTQSASGSFVVAGWGEHEMNLQAGGAKLRYAYSGGRGELSVGSVQLVIRDRGGTLAGRGWSFALGGKKVIVVEKDGSGRIAE